MNNLVFHKCEVTTESRHNSLVNESGYLFSSRFKFYGKKHVFMVNDTFENNKKSLRTSDDFVFGFVNYKQLWAWLRNSWSFEWNSLNTKKFFTSSPTLKEQWLSNSNDFPLRAALFHRCRCTFDRYVATGGKRIFLGPGHISRKVGRYKFHYCADWTVRNFTIPGIP